MSIAPFDIVNTGDVSTTGITVVFENSAGPITALTGTVFGSTVPLDGVGGATVSGLGTDTVTAIFPPNFFGPNGNSDPTSPMTTFVTINVGTENAVETDLTLTITANNSPSGLPGGGTFTVPAGPIDLSTTVVPTPTRVAETISFAPFDIINTGGISTTGITVEITNTAAPITALTGTVFGSTVPLAGVGGATVAGINTGTVTAVFPANFFGPNGNSDPGSPMTTFVTLNVVTGNSDATDLTIDITANNAVPGTGSSSTFSVDAA